MKIDNNARRTNAKTDDMQDKIIEIRRVSKKTKGGNNSSFAVLALVGDKKGKVGAGYAKALDVQTAISKAITKAKKSVIDVKIKGTTIAHEVSEKFGSAKVLLMPAPKGSGIIAGGSVRSVLALAGITDVSSKMLGSSNKSCNIMCTLKALQKLKA